MNKKKTIYIIGGGPLGINIIKWAREIGLTTIVTDKSSDAPGLEIADVPINIDASDSNLHLEYVKKLCLKYDIVGTYCQIEQSIMTGYYIREYLGIENNTFKSLERSLSKDMMKQCWSNKLIQTPDYKEIHTVDDLSEFLKSNHGDYIIKPTKGSGSRGVQVINISSDYKTAYKVCMESVGGQGHIIVEELIIGRSIDVNGILINGKLFPGGILEKYQIGNPTFLPLGGNDPVDITKKEKDQIYLLLEKSARALGLTNGPIKGDLIKRKSKYYILEVAARFHGDVTTCNTLPYGSNINPIKFYFNYLYSGEINENYLIPDMVSYAAWRVICLPPGKIKKKITSLKTSDRSITKIWYNENKCQKIKTYNDTANIPGYICAFGKDRNSVEQSLEKYFQNNTFQIKIDPNMVKWYKKLGDHLENLGFSKKSCGYQNKLIENKKKE